MSTLKRQKKSKGGSKDRYAVFGENILSDDQDIEPKESDDKPTTDSTKNFSLSSLFKKNTYPLTVL